MRRRESREQCQLRRVQGIRSGSKARSIRQIGETGSASQADSDFDKKQADAAKLYGALRRSASRRRRLRQQRWPPTLRVVQLRYSSVLQKAAQGSQTPQPRLLRHSRSSTGSCRSSKAAVAKAARHGSMTCSSSADGGGGSGGGGAANPLLRRRHAERSRASRSRARAPDPRARARRSRDR